MPADNYDQENFIVSIVSINFLYPKAATGRTKKDGIWFTTEYFSAEEPNSNPVGRSTGKIINGKYVETFYYAGDDTKKQNAIGKSMSTQDNGASAVNYFDLRHNQKKHVCTAQITQNDPLYTAEYFLPEDTEMTNPIGSSSTTKRLPWFTSTYHFKKPIAQETHTQKGGAIEMTTVSTNTSTQFAKAKPQKAANQSPTEPQKKNNPGKGKCCSIQ